MENNEISGYAGLKFRILELRAEKSMQEQEIRNKFRELADNLDPILIVKRRLHEMAGDKELQVDLLQVGLNIGSNFIINRVLGKNRSIKGFISALLFQQLSALLINKNMSGIISGIGKMMNRSADAEKEA